MGTLSYKGYHAKVDFDCEDMLLVGKVLGISDSLNFHAETAEQVEPMFHQCIEGYLEFCAQVGKTPERAYKGSFNVRVTPELHKRADLAAAERGVSLNQLVSQALEHELNGPAETVYIVTLPVQKAQFSTEEQDADAFTSLTLSSNIKRSVTQVWTIPQ